MPNQDSPNRIAPLDGLSSDDAATLHHHRVQLMGERKGAFTTASYALDAMEAAEGRVIRGKRELTEARANTRVKRRQLESATNAVNAGLIGSTPRLARAKDRLDDAEQRERVGRIEVRAAIRDEATADDKASEAKDALGYAEQRCNAANCPDLGAEGDLE